MEAFKKLMDKKLNKEGEMDPMQKKAKMELIEELRGMAEDMMKDDLHGHMDGLKKVTVASDSKEGLKTGLEKAEEVLGKDLDEDKESEEDPMHAEKAMEPESQDDLSQLSREELLAKLMEMKKKAY